MNAYQPRYDYCVETIDGGWEVQVWDILAGTMKEKIGLSCQFHSHFSAHRYGHRRVELHERQRFGEYVEEIREARRIEAARLHKAKDKARRKLLKENREKSNKARIARSLQQAAKRARELEAQR